MDPRRTVAVLAQNCHAFREQMYQMFSWLSMVHMPTKAQVMLPGVRYMYISEPDRVRGYSFDAVMLLEGYQHNPKWRETLDAVHYCMRH